MPMSTCATAGEGCARQPTRYRLRFAWHAHGGRFLAGSIAIGGTGRASRRLFHSTGAVKGNVEPFEALGP